MKSLRTVFALLGMIALGSMFALCTPQKARGQTAPSSELISVAATGVFLVEGIPVTANLSAYQSTNYDAQGRLTRKILAGNVTLYGRLSKRQLAINAQVTSIRYEGGWAVLTFPYDVDGLPMTAELSLKARSPHNLGQIKGRVLHNGTVYEDLFASGRVSKELRIYSFATSGVSVSYRRF